MIRSDSNSGFAAPVSRVKIAMLCGGIPLDASRTVAVPLAKMMMLNRPYVPALIVIDVGSTENRACPVATVLSVSLVCDEVVSEVVVFDELVSLFESVCETDAVSPTVKEVFTLTNCRRFVLRIWKMPT